MRALPQGVGACFECPAPTLSRPIVLCGGNSASLRPMEALVQVTLCVSGSVAAYKAAALARLLGGSGYAVTPLLTDAASRFVGEATFAGLTGRLPQSSLWGGRGEPHVAIAERSDAIVVAPATADLLARMASGRADDLVGATLLCAQCPVVVAPAMHPSMWRHPATQDSVQRLQDRGVRFVGPVHGAVASGDVGLGRMAEPDAIVAALGAVLRRGPLAGRHVVVSAGPTLERIDPVRALTNLSSGKMGFALAGAAVALGARVTLVSGPVALSEPTGVDRINVETALEMQAALWQVAGPDLRQADVVVMCAAVADYRPAAASDTKWKRKAASRVLELVPNPDIIAGIGERRIGERPLLVAFAAETESGAGLERRAREKLRRKRVDAVVANDVAEALGGDTTRAVWVDSNNAADLGAGSKASVARAVLERVAELLGDS